MKFSPLDKLFGQYIRMRAIQRVHGCERCLTGKSSWKELQCSHFIGRGRRSVRFDEDNAIGLCGACHMYLTAHPLEHVRWFTEHLGQEGVDLLLARNRDMIKPDEKLIAIYYREKIKELENDL